VAVDIQKADDEIEIPEKLLDPVHTRVPAPHPVSSRSSTPADNIRAFAGDVQKHVYSLVARAEVQSIDPRDLMIAESDEFRLAHRDHDSSPDHGDREKYSAVEAMTEQLRALDIVNAVLLIRITEPVIGRGGASTTEERLYTVCGKKRFLAARAAGRTSIPCKIVDFDAAVPESCRNLELDSKRALVAHALKSVAYSESEMSTKLSDETVLALLVDEFNISREPSFEAARKRFGVKSDRTEYRNMLRLWKVASCPAALDLYRRKLVRLRVLKKDHVAAVFEHPTRGPEASARIEEYAGGLRREQREDDKEPTQLKAYHDTDVETIIREVGTGGRLRNQPTIVSAVAEAVRDYRAPSFNVTAMEHRLRIPAVSLDYADQTPNNLRKMLEVSFVLRKVCDDIDSLLRAAAPESPGEPARAINIKPTVPAYRDRSYLDKVREHRFELYVNAARADATAQILSASEKRDLKTWEHRATSIIASLIEENAHLAQSERVAPLFRIGSTPPTSMANESSAPQEGSASDAQPSTAEGSAPADGTAGRREASSNG
jgi:hypothetical protein